MTKTASQHSNGIRNIGLILTGYRTIPAIIKPSVATGYEGIKTESRDRRDRNTPIQQIREAKTMMMGMMLFDQKRRCPTENPFGEIYHHAAKATA
jgi:hypothetical protein